MKDTQDKNNYLIVWANDKGTDDGKQDPDFLAVIDVNPKSSRFGRVVNTVLAPNIPHASLLDELGIRPDTPSSILNEAHHINMEVYTDPKNGHRYVFTGGLISSNIFRFDVTNPLKIPSPQLVISSRQLKKFSAADDFMLLPNGNFIASYMGAKNLGTPGGLVEFSPDGRFVREYNVAKRGGPVRFQPSIHGVTDTGLLSHPHGIDMREDLNVLVTTDFGDPNSLASSTATHHVEDLGTTIRIWKLSNLAAGPKKIIQMPDGPRKESLQQFEEPSGIMSIALTHQKNHKGAFASSMYGGALFYTPDITVNKPKFTQVYDWGPGTGVGDFKLTEDDRYILMPIAGMQSPGDPLYNRDYPGEHSRRVEVLDVQSLVRRGNKPLRVGSPEVTYDPLTGLTTSMESHNGGGPDAPRRVASLNVDSDMNFATHGGPHWLQLDHQADRFAFSDYFVDLQKFGLPGTGIGGDLKVYLGKYNQKTGAASLDRRFRDELTSQMGVDFNRPVSYDWAGERGKSGAAQPHGLLFVP